MIRIVGFGAGGHAKTVIEILKLQGEFDIVGLVDRNKELKGKMVSGIPVLGDDDLLPELFNKGIRDAFVGIGSIGDLEPRKEMYQKIRECGYKVVNAIHPQSVISPSAAINHGPTIMAGVVINADVQIGENVILNTGAIIEHDCIIGKHVQIAPGACLGGGVRVGSDTHVGIGSTVLQGIKIGKGVIVGAGAVVVDDIPDNVVVAGVPAKMIRENP